MKISSNGIPVGGVAGAGVYVGAPTKLIKPHGNGTATVGGTTVYYQGVPDTLLHACDLDGSHDRVIPGPKGLSLIVASSIVWACWCESAPGMATFGTMTSWGQPFPGAVPLAATEDGGILLLTSYATGTGLAMVTQDGVLWEIPNAHPVVEYPYPQAFALDSARALYWDTALAQWIYRDAGARHEVDVVSVTFDAFLMLAPDQVIWIGYHTNDGRLLVHPMGDAAQGYILASGETFGTSATGAQVGYALNSGESELRMIAVDFSQAMVPLAPPVPEMPIGPVGDGEPLPEGKSVDLAGFFIPDPKYFPAGDLDPRDTHGMHVWHVPERDVPGYKFIWFAKFGKLGNGAIGEGVYVPDDPNGLIHAAGDASWDAQPGSIQRVETWAKTALCPRKMRIGRKYSYIQDDDTLERRRRDTCAILEAIAWSEEVWIEGWQKFHVGGGLIMPVIRMILNNTGVREGQTTTNPDLHVETRYLAFDGRSWCEWTADEARVVFKTGHAVFPKIPKESSKFWYPGGAVYPPNPPQCLRVPVETPAPAPTPVPPPAPSGLKKPEITVENWTLNELKDGREFKCIDRINPGFGFRVWVEHGAMYASFTNPIDTGRTGLARMVTKCGPTEPPPPPPPMTRPQAEALVVAAYRDLLFRAPDPFGLDYYSDRLVDGRMTDATMRDDIKASPEYKALHPPPTPIPPGGATPNMHAWPKFGGSYATGPWRRDYDPSLFASLNRDAGGDLTRYWLLDAWAIAQNGPGQHAGIVPWLRDASGIFDLAAPNPEWDARLNQCVTIQNRAGATVQLSALNLYSWSTRTEGRQWVPDPNLGPFRRNRNGVMWSDDSTFDRLPDWVVDQLLARACAAVKGLAVSFEVAGNEFPEKSTHVKMAAMLKAHFTADWSPYISCNRNEDSPGQYFNMKIGRTIQDGRAVAQFDQIAYHGKDQLAYLDEVDPEEPASRPNTFRKLWDQTWEEGKVEPKRIIMSSDGCRKSGGLIDDCYEWDVLAEVVKDHLRRGFSFEHQSRIKMRPFLENRLDLHDFEGAWLRSLR